jgi:hypothetical protein
MMWISGKVHSHVKHIPWVLLPPYVLQVCFNVFGLSSWYAYWPLVLVTSLVPLLWLVFGKLASAYAAGLIQTATLLWFNWLNYCSAKEAFSGEYSFVGGLGVVYVVVLSVFGGILVGGVLYLSQRKPA